MLKKMLMIAGAFLTVAIVAESVSESIVESETEEHKVVSIVKKVPVHIAFKIAIPVYDKLAIICDKLASKIDSWEAEPA